MCHKYVLKYIDGYSSCGYNWYVLPQHCHSTLFTRVPLLSRQQPVDETAGIGLVTPLGIGVAENWYKILAGQSGITQLCPEHLPAKHQHVFTKLPSHVIGAVDEQALATAKTNVFWARSGLSRQEEFVEVAATEVCALSKSSCFRCE